MQTNNDEFILSCPAPLGRHAHVQMAHGGGGTLMRQLIETVFLSAFDNPALNQRNDSAILEVGGVRLAFTTDSYVVQPLFFPGGDIGSLAVHGTVNDLAMAGARPLYLSAGFILEEGLEMDVLQRIVHSMQEAAKRANVQLVTGDTKVVNRGKGDSVFINTAGIGVVERGVEIGPHQIQVGDAIVINGDLGRHGIAIMATREGLEFETTIESDSAPIADLVMDLLAEGVEVHCMRDLTRGGLASAANEIADTAGKCIHLEESEIPVREDVRGACEILGFDPLYVANEGRFMAIVSSADAERAVRILRQRALGSEACIIGRVTAEPAKTVTLRSTIGATRIVDMLSGEQLPRIC